MMQAWQASRVVLSIVVVLFASSANGQLCTEEAVEECIRMQLSSANGGATNESDAEQLTACSNYTEVLNCVEPMRNNCTAEQKSQIESIKRGYVYCQKENMKANGELCTEETVKECAKDLRLVGEQRNVVRTFMQRLLSTVSGRVIRKSEAAQLLQTECSNFIEFLNCVEPMRNNCVAAQELQIEIIESGYNFFCDEENMKESLKHSVCLSGKLLTQKLRKCRNDYEADIRTFRGVRSCRVTRGYLDCILRRSLRCGEKAARWNRKVHWHFVEPTLHLIHCNVQAEFGIFVSYD